MTAPTTWNINGVPIENYGMYLSNFSGHLDLAERQYMLASPLQRDGQVVLAQGSKTSPRQLVFNFFVQPSSFADRIAKVNALHAALRGRLELISAEDTSKVLYGYVSKTTVTPAGKWFVQPEVNHACTIMCFDPLWYDVTPPSVNITSVNTPVTLPIGSAITKKVRIVLNGAVTNPVTLTLVNGSGASLATMTIAGALTGAQYYEINCDPDNPFLLMWSAGVSTDSIGLLGALETFFTLEPLDQPALKIDKGTATVYVTRAYES